MYAVQPTRYHPREPNWQDYHCHHHAGLSSHLRNWLLDSGSLTQRLVKASDNQFRVEVLSQSWQTPRLSEAKLLDMPPRQQALIREVVLFCGDQPRVFARSVLPATSLTGHLRFLRHFDSSSLGAMLFKDPTMFRHPFQLVCIASDDQTLPLPLRQAGDICWGRRSRFELSAKPLMVSEFFLPGFLGAME